MWPAGHVTDVCRFALDNGTAHITEGRTRWVIGEDIEATVWREQVSFLHSTTTLSTPPPLPPPHPSPPLLTPSPLSPLSLLLCTDLSNPIDMVFHLQPVMIITLLPLAIPVDGDYSNLYSNPLEIFWPPQVLP